MIIVESFGCGGEPRAPPSPKPAAAQRCYDARHHLTPHTARQGTTLPALHRGRASVSNGTRRIIDQASSLKYGKNASETC